MLYRNCGKCARITKHNIVSLLCMVHDTEQTLEDALEKYRQDTKYGAKWWQ